MAFLQWVQKVVAWVQGDTPWIQDDSQGRISWADYETPNVGEVLKTPPEPVPPGGEPPRYSYFRGPSKGWFRAKDIKPDRVGAISKVKVETPTPIRAGRIMYVGMFIPSKAIGLLRDITITVPLAPRFGKVWRAKIGVWDAPRRAIVTGIRAEIPTAPRAGRIARSGLGAPVEPRAGRIAVVHGGLPTPRVRGFLELGVPGFSASRYHPAEMYYRSGKIAAVGSEFAGEITDEELVVLLGLLN